MESQLNPDQREWNELAKQYEHIKSIQNSGQAKINNWYGDHFNFVDLHDRRFYQVEYKHRILHWRTMFTQSLINVFLINLWVLWNQRYPTDLLTFRKNLALFLLAFNPS